VSIAELKAGLDLRLLVEQSHAIDRSGKVACPFHDDLHPSCHVYPDGFKCFACGAFGDHLDWIEGVYGLSTSEALERLTVAAHGSAAPLRRPAPRAARPRIRDRAYAPVGDRAHRRYLRLLARTRGLPRALEGRGLDPWSARRLGLAAIGDDVLLPIRGPRGRLLALKRRLAEPRGGQRYLYTTAGHGSPAWCSPDAGRRPLLLVVEGELNGMLAHLALLEAGALVGVMAPAGAGGGLHPGLLGEREIYLLADDDEAGRKALVRWQTGARRAGAASVTPLAPLPVDACELAALHGRRGLAARLIAAMFHSDRGERGVADAADRLPVLSR
jgi:DNA primase